MVMPLMQMLNPRSRSLLPSMLPAMPPAMPPAMLPSIKTASRTLTCLVWASLLTLVFSLGLAVEPTYALSAPDGLIQDLGVDLDGKNFSGLTLQDKRFTKLDLEEANFQGADLTGSVFNGSDLMGANLQAVNFAFGIAYHSDFRKADFSNALMIGSYLLQSQFDGAIVTNADFTDAVLDYGQQLKLCATASGTNPVTGADTRRSLGCRG